MPRENSARNKVNHSSRFIILFILAVMGMGIFDAMDLRSDLNSDRTEYTSVTDGLDGLDQLYKARLHFKKQVQEWKNVLLRGGNDRDSYTKYLRLFFAEENKVRVHLSAAVPLLSNIRVSHDVLSALDGIGREHADLGSRYRLALESFDVDNAQSYKIVDSMVRGIDREPTDKIDQLLAEAVTRVKTLIADEQLREMTENRKKVIKTIATLLLLIVTTVLIVVWNRRLLEEVTRRVAIEEVLRGQAEELRLFYDLPFIGMAITSPATKQWNVVNHYLCQMLGYSKEELVQLTWASMTHPEDLDADLGHFQRVMQGESDGYVMDKRFIRKDGREVNAVVNVQAIRGKDGQVQRFFATAMDITERKRMENALRHTLKQAEAATKAKGEFLAAMSHEIRTPMNGVLGMADLVLRTELTERQRHCVETIHRSGQLLLRIINDILDLSKIQVGRMIMEIVQFDLGDVLRDVHNLLKDQALDKGLLLTFQVSDGVPDHLQGDPYRLSQILFNLLGNAVKFTEWGSVSLLVETVEDRDVDTLLRFQVIDTGIGISPDYQRQIFQAFSQEDASISRRFGGTGLGLAITRQLVEIMGGQFGLTSVPGQGSTFWFTVPYGKQRAGDQQAVAAWLASRQSLMPDDSQFKGHVLLVEDNLVNQDVAVAILELFGCQVTVADNGLQAIELLQQAATPFDLVLMDCEMPIQDGFETTKRLRNWEAQSERSATPVVALTAHVLQESRQQCSAAGMDGYLGKPFSLSGLGSILHRWLPQVSRDVAESRQAGRLPTDQEHDDLTEPLPDAVKIQESVSEEAWRPTPVLDQVALERILDLVRNGGSGLLDRMVGHYLTRTPGLLAELEQAVTCNDAEGVRVAAHTLKSSSLTMGVTSLAELGRSMEMDHADGVKVRQHFQLTAPAFAAAKQALNDLIVSQQQGKSHE